MNLRTDSLRTATHLIGILDHYFAHEPQGASAEQTLHNLPLHLVPMSLGADEPFREIPLQNSSKDDRLFVNVGIGHNVRNGPWIEGEQAVMNEERSSDLEGRAIRLHPRIDLLAVVVAIISSCARIKLMISDDSLQHIGPMSRDSFSSWWTLQGSKR